MFSLSQSKKFTLLKFINNYFLPTLVVLSLITVVSLMIYVAFISTFKLLEIINILVIGFTSFGVLIAYKQITINADLQRRQLALTNIKIITESNKKHRDELEKSIDYTNIFKNSAINSKPLTITEIQKILFEFDSDGNLIGKGNHMGQPYKFSDNGKVIHSHIIEILNNFETLAIGILNNVYDETIMKEYFDNIIKTNFVVYQIHIKYLRNDIINDEKYCENFEWLYYEWNKDKNPIKNKR